MLFNELNSSGCKTNYNSRVMGQFCSSLIVKLKYNKSLKSYSVEALLIITYNTLYNLGYVCKAGLEDLYYYLELLDF